MTKFRIGLIIFSFYLINLQGQTRITTDFKDYRLEVVKLNNIDHLEVFGKHAEINISNWDKDSISIETTTEIMSNKPNLSKELLEAIDIKIISYANKLMVKTSLNEDFSSTIPYKIIYNIIFPKNLKLSLKNSYGSVNISEVDNGTHLNLSYCDININNLNAINDSVINEVNLSYCNGVIEKIGSSKLDANNSELDINEAVNLNSNTEYSNIVIKKLNTFTGTSNIDIYKISHTDNIKMKTLSSNIVLSSFKDSALFECNKGKLEILNSSESFKQLTINNIETITSVHLNEHSSYILNGEIVNASFIHPNIESFKIIKDNITSSISGEINTKTETDSKVIIFNNNANIEFK